MEPQLIDYYNDEPHGVNVIEKLEEEYEEAMAKIKQLEEERDRYKYKLKRFNMPRFKVSSVEEYEKYDRAIDLFEENVVTMLDEDDDLSVNLFDELSNFTNEHETYELPLINKLINELNKLTEYQNEEWSKFRILHALELSGCAIQSDNMDSNVILSTIIGSWAAPRPPPVLSASLNGITRFHKFSGWSSDDIARSLRLPRKNPLNLYTLCYYDCAKCGKEDDYGNLYDKEYNKLDILLCNVCHDIIKLNILM